MTHGQNEEYQKASEYQKEHAWILRKESKQQLVDSEKAKGSRFPLTGLWEAPFSPS